MNDMMYTFRAMLVKFKDPSNPSNHGYDILDKCFMRANNSCSKPVEPLYYSCNYPESCVHCGSKQRLTSRINEYPMCTTCKVLKNLPPVLKHKRRKELLPYTLLDWCYVFMVFRVYFCTCQIYYKYTFFQHLLISEPASNVFKAENLYGTFKASPFLS